MTFRSTAILFNRRTLPRIDSPSSQHVALCLSARPSRTAPFIKHQVRSTAEGAFVPTFTRNIGSSALGTLPLQVTVGILCASFWRGAWYIFDYTLFPNDRFKSSIASLSFGSTLLGMEQFILSRSYNGTKWLVRVLPPPSEISLRTYFKKINRFTSLYGIAIGCILVWRGAWVMWDVAADAFSECILKTESSNHKNDLAQDHGSHEHEDSVSGHEIDKTLLYSGVASHAVATLGLLFIGRFKSVMAPPANVSMMRDIFIHGKGKDFAKAARSFTSHSP